MAISSPLFSSTVHRLHDAGLQTDGEPSTPRRTRSGRQPSFGLATSWMLAAIVGSVIVQIAPPLAHETIDQLTTGSIERLSPEPIDRKQAVALARAALLRLDDANRTGNYAVFCDMAAPDFKRINSPADLERIFAWLRNDGLALTSAAALEATSLQPTVLEKNGILHVRGALPGIPGGLGFDLLLQRAANEWLIFGIAVYRG